MKQTKKESKVVKKLPKISKKRLKRKIFDMRKKAEQFREDGNHSDEMICLLKANFWETELEILSSKEVLLHQILG